VKVIFIKSCIVGGVKQVVGQKGHIWPTKARELIEQGYARQYDGPMNIKTRIKLSNLK